MDVSFRERGTLAFGTFRLDPLRRTLWRDDREVPLTARLFDTLLYLAQNPERLVTRDELETAVWGGRVVEEGNLQKAISSLRKAMLTEGSTGTPIVTVPGRGFRFAVPVRFEPEAAEPLGPLAFADVAFAGSLQPSPPAGRRARWAAAGLGAAALALAGGLAWHVAGRPASFAPPPHSVAVLAFANMSGDPNQAYFSDGLAEEVINALSEVNQLRVAARVSAFSFRGSNATIADIARKLDVGAILEGSVRREGARVRISVVLIDTRTGYSIWTRSVDRDQHDLLDLEREIATDVTHALQVDLAPGDAARLTLGGTADPQAFDFFLRGMQLARSMQEGNLPAAVECFDKAIALDPTYAAAYAARAVQFVNLASTAPPGASPREITSRCAAALASADTAVALAPGLGSAHSSRSIILLDGYQRMGDAMAEAAHARALEPGTAAIVANYAQVAVETGHARDAPDAARLATTLDPLRPDIWYIDAYVLYVARQFDGVLEAARHERALRGTMPEHSQLLVALSHYLKGDLPDAEAACPGVGADWIDGCLAMVEHASGRTDSAQAHLAHLRTQSSDADFYQLAEIAAQWGDLPAALDFLEKAKSRNDPTLSDIGTDPLLDPLSQQKQFQDLVRTIGK